MLGKKRKDPAVEDTDASDLEWKSAFEAVLRDLVPGEKFELTCEKEGGGTTKFSIITESRRAMVAWAEIQSVLKPEIFK